MQWYVLSIMEVCAFLQSAVHFCHMVLIYIATLEDSSMLASSMFMSVGVCSIKVFGQRIDCMDSADC